MKKYLFSVIIAIAFTACNQGVTKSNDNSKDSSVAKPVENKSVSKDSVYGVSFDYSSPVKLTDLMKDPSKLDTTKYIAVSAVLTTVCQTRGCWFRAEDGKGGDVFIKILGEKADGEELGIPMNTPPGGSVIFYGTPKYKKVSVKTQKHYAEEGGKTKAEIDAIKEPKMEWRFFATGVVVKG